MEFDPLQLAAALDPMQPPIPPPQPDDGFFPTLSAYSPQEADSKMEGGYASARKGPHGETTVRTLDDYASGNSDFVTLAGNPKQFGREYTVPEMPYLNSRGEQVMLKDVRGVVHDTGKALRNAPDNRFDVAVGKNYNNQQMNAQPWSMRNNVQFRHRF